MKTVRCAAARCRFMWPAKTVAWCRSMRVARTRPGSQAPHSFRRYLLIACLFSLANVAPDAVAAELMISRASDLHFSRNPTNGELVFDLYERLWKISATGGIADALDELPLPLNRPVFSPDGKYIAAETIVDDYRRVLVIDVASGIASDIFPGPWNAQMPAWSPDGSRLAVSSDRDGSFDIWEMDTSGMNVRKRSFSSHADFYPSYAPTEDQLLWIQSAAHDYRLMSSTRLRLGEALYQSANALLCPKFRPDGSLITVYQDQVNGRDLLMVLPGQPVVVKTLLRDTGFIDQPPLWLDRHSALVSTRGEIRKFTFASTLGERIPFTAWVSVAEPVSPRSVAPSASSTAHSGRYVLRLGGIIDGIRERSPGAVDIVVNNERIEAIVEHRDWGSDTQILDYSEYFAVPGLIALLAEEIDYQHQASDMLAAGFTSVACLARDCELDQPGGETPAPVIYSTAHFEILPPFVDNEQRESRIETARTDRRPILTTIAFPDLAIGANMLIAGPKSLTNRALHDDFWSLIERTATRIVVDFDEDLVAVQWPVNNPPTEAAFWPAVSSRGTAFIVALSYQRRSVARAADDVFGELDRQGASPVQSLRAMTLDAAQALGVAADTGTLTPGKFADLLLVYGDPSADIRALRNISGIVRRGQFYTRAGIERLAVE